MTRYEVVVLINSLSYQGILDKDALWVKLFRMNTPVYAKLFLLNHEYSTQ